tara:strand:- start:302 stop:424 length:123 start_codon:yes stop_codon:yes gene_type:complete
VCSRGMEERKGENKNVGKYYNNGGSVLFDNALTNINTYRK